MQDATKLCFGSGGSSDREVSTFAASPTTYPAGTVVRLKSDDTISKLKSDGALLGVSMGKSLSDTSRIAIARSGNYIPILIKSGLPALGTIVITSYANLVSGTDDAITINGTAFTAQAGAATPGDATFQAATSNNATATSLRAQINAHATIGLLVKAGGTGANVTLTALTRGTAGNSITLTYTDNDTNIGATVSGATLSGGSASSTFCDEGKAVYVNDLTGIAEESSEYSTVTGAFYQSAALTGVYPEDGTTAAAAYIDMAGGL